MERSSECGGQSISNVDVAPGCIGGFPTFEGEVEDHELGDVIGKDGGLVIDSALDD